MHPAVTAAKNAEIGLHSAMSGSSSAQVMEMESIPVSGVDIIKAAVAPLLAPCSFREAAAGRTPQEHSGMGMPNMAALNTELNLPLPRCAATYSGERNIFSIPPATMPKMI
jgi:hypothetical protein